jgi:hypothetical protein
MTTDIVLGVKMEEFAVKYERKLGRLKFSLREVESSREKLVQFRRLLKGFSGGNRAIYPQLKILRDDIRRLGVDIDEALTLERKLASLGESTAFSEAAITLIGAGLRDWTFLDLLVDTAMLEPALSGIAHTSAIWRSRQNILDGLKAMVITLYRHPLATREPLDKLSEQLRAFQRNIQLIQANIRECRLAARLMTGSQEYYDRATDLYRQMEAGKLTQAEVETHLGAILNGILHVLDAGRVDYIDILIAQPLHLNKSKVEAGSRSKRVEEQPADLELKTR